VSIDLEATLRTPITLALLIDRARTVLSDLLGGVEVPDIAVMTDYRRARRLGPAGLSAAVIGEPIEPDEGGLSGSIFYDIEVTTTSDAIRLMVIDFIGEASIDDDRHAVFSPSRTCVGVTVATGLALAAAQLADGEFVDDEIRMLTPPVREPDEFIGRTRLSGPADAFAVQCVKYARQFPALKDLP
jgi:hypothetical protein